MLVLESKLTCVKDEMPPSVVVLLPALVVLPESQWVAASPWRTRPLWETLQFTTTSSSSACINRLKLLRAHCLLRKSSHIGSGARIVTPPLKRPAHVNTETELVQASIQQNELRFYVVFCNQQYAATVFIFIFFSDLILHVWISGLPALITLVQRTTSDSVVLKSYIKDSHGEFAEAKAKRLAEEMKSVFSFHRLSGRERLIN